MESSGGACAWCGEPLSGRQYWACSRSCAGMLRRRGKRPPTDIDLNGRRCVYCNAPLFGATSMFCSRPCARYYALEQEGAPFLEDRRCEAADCDNTLSTRQRRWCSKRCERRERYRSDAAYRARVIARTSSSGRRARREAREEAERLANAAVARLGVA